MTKKEPQLTVGVTIIVCACDNIAEASECLDSIVKHNSYKPIEVLLCASKPLEAISKMRPLMRNLLVRVLPSTAAGDIFNLICKAIYKDILIVDPATRFQTDILPEWIKNRCTNVETALLCTKNNVCVSNNKNIKNSQQLSRLHEIIVYPQIKQKSNFLDGKNKNQIQQYIDLLSLKYPQKSKSKNQPTIIQSNFDEEKNLISKELPKFKKEKNQLEIELKKYNEELNDLEKEYSQILTDEKEKAVVEEKIYQNLLTINKIVVKLNTIDENGVGA